MANEVKKSQVSAQEAKGQAVSANAVPAVPASKEVKKTESKANRFRRIAQMRVAKALKSIGILCNLGNTQTYEYLPEQAAKIVAALSDAVDKVKNSFDRSVKVHDMFQL